MKSTLLVIAIALIPFVSFAEKGDPLDKTNYKMTSDILIEAFGNMECIEGCAAVNSDHEQKRTAAPAVRYAGRIFLASFSAELARRTVDFTTDWFESLFSDRKTERLVRNARHYLLDCSTRSIFENEDGAYVEFECEGRSNNR